MNGPPTPWSYDVHGLVRIRTNIAHLEIPEYFRVPATDPNLELVLVPTLAGPGDGERKVGFGAYSRGSGGMLFESEVPFLSLLGSSARWRTLIQGLEGETTRIATSIPFVRVGPVRSKATEFLARMIRIVLGLKLLAKGRAPAYLTSLARENAAVLLAGYSWTGKSMAASALVKEGFAYLSDDYSLLDESGYVDCFPDWHQPRRPSRDIRILRYLNRRNLDYRHPVVAEPPVCRRAKSRSLLFLERGPDSVEDIDADEALRRLRLINGEEITKNWSSPAAQIVSYYAYFHPAMRLDRLLLGYDRYLSALVDSVESRKVLRSRSPGFEGLRGTLTGIGGGM